MDKEALYKKLLIGFLLSIQKRFPESDVVPQIFESLEITADASSAKDSISPAESLLLNCWEEHPDYFSGTVYHPLTSKGKTIALDSPQKVLVTLKSIFAETEFKSWREKYYFLWRFWKEMCPADSRQIPADDRLPGTSLFSQLDINSVMEYCRANDSKPAFLLFQIGPVQSFIATARSTMDLLSGSYLVAWLVSSALKTVSEEVCPGCVIFPNLRGQGIFDLQNKDILDSIKTNSISCWETIRDSDQARLFSPTIPNRFLALVPANTASDIAKVAEQSIHKTWKDICDSCFEEMKNLMPEVETYKQRWDGQTQNFIQITWQTYPFPNKLPDTSSENLSHFKKIVEDELHKSFDLSMFGWSLFFKDISALHAARRNTREFRQFITDDHQDLTPKDALTGKEEIIGTKDSWAKMLRNSPDTGFVFKKNERPYGALTIIKRLWMTNYLQKKYNLDIKNNKKILSTEEIARKNDPSNDYIAVLALDGDGMGQWINGDRTPCFLDQLAPKSREYFSNLWRKYNWPKNEQMPVTPEYHLQFSEALATFANKEAAKIVEENNGLLIYAGGDDILALLPASSALNCATMLRERFRQTENGDGYWLPGENATVSCGIAVGHKTFPLQLLIDNARRAEHRAKATYNRNALAISVFKRSGEILEWGASFDSPGIQLLKVFQNLMKEDNPKISRRFASALAQLLAPYQLEKESSPNVDNMIEIISADFQHICKQQCSSSIYNTPEKIGLEAYSEYLEYLLAENKLSDFSNLFLVGIFLLRGEKGDSNDKPDRKETM